MAIGLQILIGMVLVLVSFHYIYKIVKEFTSIRKAKDVKAEFISDMYRLQIKYAKKGYYDYSEGINFMIRTVVEIEQEQPKTPYGAAIKEALTNNEPED